MKRVAGTRPCLAAGLCRDVGAEVGFGMGCASAHISISAKSFGREPIGFLVSPPGRWKLGAFGFVLVLVTPQASRLDVFFGDSLALAVSFWQLLGSSSLVLAVSLGQVLPGCFAATNLFLSLCRSVLVGFLGGSLALVVLLWQFLVGGSWFLAPGWLVGVGSFLPGVLPPQFGLCSALLI